MTEPPETLEAITSWDQLDAVRRRNRGWLKLLLDETPGEVFHAETTVWEGTPAEMRASIAEVVTHLLLHERGHHGDVSTLIERLGGTPPAVDYLVYRWFRQRAAR